MVWASCLKGIGILGAMKRRIGDNACGRAPHPALLSNAEKGIMCALMIRWWCVRAPS